MNIPIFEFRRRASVCLPDLARQARERFPKNSNASNDGNRDAD